ncbi:hypothetical protein R6Q59_009260 [Mikania micrantha]
MDVFSLLKFWRNTGVGDPSINAPDIDFTDDEGSFFDLVFTNPNNQHLNTLPLDSSNTKTPRSPFRVFMLGFQNPKLKSAKKEIKCDFQEVTISTLLKRDNSFRSEKLHHHMSSKRFSKDVLHRYLNLIKPLVSKRSNENFRLHQHHTAFSPKKEEVFKHLGKSRSSSLKPSARRDDSALQQHDGIQSAILHCKKSYNSPSQGCHVLSRSGSAPSQASRISIDDEQKRSSI